MILYENKQKPIEIDMMDHHSFVPHVHNALEIVICVEGVLKTSCCSRTELLHPGDAMIAFSHELHAYHESSGGTGIMLIVSPMMLHSFAARLNTRRYENFRLAGDSRLIQLAGDGLRAFADGCSSDILTGYLYLILGTILQDLPYKTVSEPVSDQDTFTKVLEYLSAHYTEQISLKMLAQRFGVDHSHLSRTFAAKLSCGYLDYLHQLRVEHAKTLLTENGDKIAGIAFQCGFADQRSFNRVFKKWTGLTPREYRQTSSMSVAK